MSYQITLSGEAQKQLDRLAGELSSNPFNPKISKLLTQARGKRSSRVGSWRVIYQVNRPIHDVQIIAVLPRGKAYRRLG